MARAKPYRLVAPIVREHPVPRNAGKICERCGTALEFYQRHGRFCSAACANRARANVASLRLVLNNSIPEPNSGCWLWTGATTPAGYGVTSIRGQWWLAHRLSYAIAGNSELGPGVIIRHRCDNPPCVNPDHLLAGTVQDNSNDAVARGLTDRGSDRYNAKLTEGDIPLIREALKCGEAVSQIATRYGVSGKCIHLVHAGKRWRHVE